MQGNEICKRSPWRRILLVLLLHGVRRECVGVEARVGGAPVRRRRCQTAVAIRTRSRSRSHAARPVRSGGRRYVVAVATGGASAAPELKIFAELNAALVVAEATPGPARAPALGEVQAALLRGCGAAFVAVATVSAASAPAAEEV